MKVRDLKILLVIGIVLAISLSTVAEILHQRAPKEAISVGVFLDLSGHTAYFGRSTLNGIELAADQINQAGGIDGRRIELLVKDDLGRPTETVDAVRDLIDRKKVHAVIGDVASSLSLAAAPIAQNAKVPMITPSGTHPAVTQVGNYIFRACFTDPLQGEALAEFAAKNLKARRAALLVDRSSDYSSSIEVAFERRFMKLGGKVVVKQSYMQGDRDFMAQLVSMRSRKPDVIVVPGYYNEAGEIAKQARRIGIRKPLLGVDGWDSTLLWEFGGASLNGSYITNHYASDRPSAANAQFVQKYKARYRGLEPDALAALGYDAMRLLADAVRRARSTDGPALREALAETTNFEGVTGSITIDRERNAIKSVVILRLQDGRFIYERAIIPSK
jgi:branched-chain amino acid transport system substrate-binding protein